MAPFSRCCWSTSSASCILVLKIGGTEFIYGILGLLSGGIIYGVLGSATFWIPDALIVAIFALSVKLPSEKTIPESKYSLSHFKKMKTKEKILVIILRTSGLLLITAFAAIFLPYETMAQIHRQIGLGDFPQLPILDYLARSVSLFYAIHGVIVLYISFDVRNYLPFLKLLCYLGFVFGVTLFFIDLNAPMPASWTFSEGPMILILNLVIYALVLKIEKEK